MTPLVRRLGIDHPLFLSPMAGGPTTPALVAAVCDAGGLGSLACGMSSPATIAADAAAVRALTTRPFAMNMFWFTPPVVDQAAVERSIELLAPTRAALGLPPPSLPAQLVQDVDAQAEAVLAVRPPVVSFTFGLPPARWMERFKAAGCVLLGTATTVDEARAWAVHGADAIVAQGAEAGGHRGTFLGDPARSLIGLVALVPRIVDAVALPVVAAGGIMDGRGLAAALALGAQAGQLGTAFLTCPEAGTSAPARARLLAAGEGASVVSRVWSGRHARGLAGKLSEVLGAHAGELPAYPIQGALTADLRSSGHADLMMILAGQGAGRNRQLPAGELVAAIVSELEGKLPAASRV